jgi:hypothetical protein
MEARIARALVLLASLASLGAGYKTPNFVVSAPTPEMAKEIGEAAERYRNELAVVWLGKPLPNWSEPCPIKARVSDQLGAGGATSFMFDRGHVFGWKMDIQGSLDRILDSVLPHEVTHTIFASHFRQALPRWADEGACTTVEHVDERHKLERMLVTYLKTGKGIAFSRMFAMKEYPPEMLPLYSQGYALAEYLIGQGGRRKFMQFLGDGLQDENWPRVIEKYYGYESLLALQDNWLDWVREGRPALDRDPDAPGATLVAQSDESAASGSGDTGAAAQAPEETLLASASGAPYEAGQPTSVYRGQSPDPPAAEEPPLVAVDTSGRSASDHSASGSGRLVSQSRDRQSSRLSEPVSRRPRPPEGADASQPPPPPVHPEPLDREVILHWSRSPSQGSAGH